MTKYEELVVRIIDDLIKDVAVPDIKDYMAAGIVGNFAVETGRFKFMQEITPVKKGSKGGYGWAQWTGPRRRSFEAWARNHYWEPNSYEANYSFLIREMVSTKKAAYEALLRTKTVEEAAKVWMNEFERPGIPHEAKRISEAKEALRIYRNAPPILKQPEAELSWLEKLIEWIKGLFK